MIPSKKLNIYADNLQGSLGMEKYIWEMVVVFIRLDCHIKIPQAGCTDWVTYFITVLGSRVLRSGCQHCLFLGELFS